MTPQNTLFTNDNLFVLHGLKSATIDLIYLDPPFSGQWPCCTGSVLGRWTHPGRTLLVLFLEGQGERRGSARCGCGAGFPLRSWLDRSRDGQARDDIGNLLYPASGCWRDVEACTSGAYPS